MTNVPADRSAHSVVLFDGLCNFCSEGVRWIVARDRRDQFRFASLQSRAAQLALAAAGVKAPLPDSVILIDGDRVLMRSAAAIGIAKKLGLPWSLAAMAMVVPGGVRDWVYAWVARNRYKWFGKQESCMLPTAGLAARFLPEPPAADASGDVSPGQHG